MSAWQPIATAPKDGTIVILGWRLDDEDDWFAIGGWYESGPADMRWYAVDNEPASPTHWVPFPRLPK
jgi:hypothetical protein